MFGGGGPSGLMYILRADALETQRGENPDLAAIYAPGTLRQARRRPVAVVTFVAAFAGLVLALSTQFEAAWIGSPIRPWTRVSLLGFVLVFVLA